MEVQTPIFALDIGTRSVIGIIIQPLTDGTFQIKDIKIVEHKERSMLDGQIHDVLAVAETITQVKNQLEVAHGPLKSVSVAAAGRSLKTKRVKIDISIDGQPLLRKEDIRGLELSAVQEAQKNLITNTSLEDTTHYHCVGYSVVNYYIDGQIIGNLLDQRGKKASVEIIATFLPRVVVDSLISSLKRSGLEMEALTLEPIAAIHVLIPPSMRRLNIAFVDIGAGTSDIAITDEGTIIAYGMVPVAGDEITEAISQLYLLDFHIAEEIKRKSTVEKEIAFTDILGQTYTLPTEVIVSQIEKSIIYLADHIAKKIMELNKKAPQAVMLVGGGSQTPTLTEKIAELLGLTHQRVAVRGADAIQQKIEWPNESYKGPELVTPIGIGISSMENPIQYLTFAVNGEVIHLFEMKSLTVGDALIAAGISIKSLFGKPGLAMTVNINGQIKIIPGEHGTLPIIRVNGEAATIDTSIKNSDRIEVTPGKNGRDALLTIQEALKYSEIKPFSINIEGKMKEILPQWEINGVDTSESSIIKDRDIIKFFHIKTIEEALIMTGYSTIPFTKKIIEVEFMDEKKSITYYQKKLYKNGEPVDLDASIEDGDVLTFDKTTIPYPTIRDLISEDKKSKSWIKVIFNGKKLNIQPSSFQVQMDHMDVPLDTPLKLGSKIAILWNDEDSFQFSDVFRYVDFERTNPAGTTRYVIKINGEIADFNAPIKNGDNLELYWE